MVGRARAADDCTPGPPPCRRGSSAAIGLLAPLAFTTFRMANQPFEVFAHLAYGTLLSFAFFGSDARRGKPVLALGRRSAGALS